MVPGGGAEKPNLYVVRMTAGDLIHRCEAPLRQVPPLEGPERIPSLEALEGGEVHLGGGSVLRVCNKWFERFAALGKLPLVIECSEEVGPTGRHSDLGRRGDLRHSIEF
jgi:hypothetical protein